MLRINNEILLDFIHCPYKAYRKSKHQKGIISDYETLYGQLKQAQKISFEKSISKNSKPILHQITFNGTIPKESIALDFNFKNENIDLAVDGIEFFDKKKFIPIFITPFEKVTRTDKFFLALQAFFIQNEFNLQVENCKVVFGKGIRQTRFKLSSFAKTIKKEVVEMGKILSNSNAPQFFRNNHCQVCEFQQDCLERLIERDDLSLLAGLKPKEIQQKNNRGIFSVKQLSFSFHPKKNPYRKRKFLPELKALAIREGKTFIQEIPTIPASPNIVFLDIEGIPDRNFYYLIGAIVKTNDTETNYSFWANDESEEQKIFLELFTLLQSLSEFTILHYGSYETQALKTISKVLPQEHQEFAKKVIDSSFNLLSVFTHTIYPPTYSNSLKDIARFIKFDWTEKNASGLQSIVWRCHWEMAQNDELKHKLIQYNIEDCKALIKVKSLILNIASDGNNIFEKTENIKKDSIFKWQRNKFLIANFDQINRFAYFNYQREKVLFKTYPKIVTRQKTINYQKLKSKKLKPNKIVLIPRPKNCPKCKGTKFYKHDKQYRTIIDLKFSKTYIRRQITLYHMDRFGCRDCGYIFTPKDSITLAHSKYGRMLSCWVVNQSIFYRNSYNKISEQLKESFGINYISTTTGCIKSQFSEFYKPTFDEIVEYVKSNRLIHIDETMFNVRKESTCYVWVFTNIDAVFYLYRPTRESDFLKELLVDFKGVLISDFYAGYDAVNCPKQRCLIHLIRDLNDDFVKNQLDNDFKIMVLKFSQLLNEIVATVNKFGLKKRNLNKHKKAVSFFFKSLGRMYFESEICVKWQKRFNVFKDELFTFLDYDGIPWNNNNAENAIKAVALYRREADGLVTKKRIQEDLTLLSIQQTCKFRNVSFFEFLKSGEKSIFKYSEKHK